MSVSPDLHANQSKLIFIDSEDAEADYSAGDGAGLSADFILDLEEPIICPENQIMLASMYSCSIPYSFYDIRNDVNDKIQFRIGSAIVGYETFDIDFGAILAPAPYYNLMNSHGNYNVTSLSVQVNLIFTQLIRAALIANPAGPMATINSTITLDYIENKQRFVIMFNDFAAGLTVQLQQQGAGYMDSEIGLPEDDAVVRLFAATAAGTTYILPTPNVVDITGSTHGLFLRTNLASDSTIASDTGRGTDILAHIPITGNQGDIIHSSPQSNLHKSRIKVKALNHIHIQIRDERNRPMDFNGLHTHIVLLIDFVYERKKIIPDMSFRRQKEVFQHKIARNMDELAAQGFKGPIDIRAHSRPIRTREPDLIAQSHDPQIEYHKAEDPNEIKEKAEEEEVEEEEKEEEKMEEVEETPVEQTGLSNSEVPVSTLIKDTI